MKPTEEQLNNSAMQDFAKLWGWSAAIKLLWPSLCWWESAKCEAKMQEKKNVPPDSASGC